ncbi:M56 family metallopeptidase [uncultured Oscillibacter sp.]|uniref:M56 family metallopeptidase n=1 Tax=uncultured Oscillibacter sp. TaxID=876091 RepID=UPI002805B7BF|nr:M56 family metallopeptidase [uncultured Oscillibacter sp.]
MSLFQMSVAGGVLILFIVVIRAVAIHRLPKTTFFVLWLIAALRLLLPLSIPLPGGLPVNVASISDAVQDFAAQNFVQENEGGSSSTQAPPSFAPNVEPGVQFQATAQEIERVPVFVVVWLAGSLLLAAYFAISYLRSLQKFRMSLPDNTPYVQRWLSEHRITRPLEVRSSDLISSPLTYGILRPVILLPKKFDRSDETALQYVLAHEYIHIRRFDAITKILFAATLCVHWFNPLVWVMYVLANRDVELSCDGCVLRMLGEKERSAYARALIRMEERKNGMSALYSHFSKNAITERIEAIMKFKKTSIAACALALVVTVGATTAFAVSSSDGNGSHSWISRDDATLIDLESIDAKLSNTGTDAIQFADEADEPKLIDLTDAGSIFQNSELAMVELLDDNSTGRILESAGDCFMSLENGMPMTIGVGNWKQGNTFELNSQSEKANEIKLTICSTSTGETWPYILETGTGRITFTAPYDGEFEISVENLSATNAKLSITYALNSVTSIDHMAHMDSSDLQNIVHMDMTLVSVSHDDESKFTPEEWAEILKQIELGNISWED